MAPSNLLPNPALAPDSLDALVCVIDDDLPCCLGLERLLKSAGHAAKSFSSGEEYLAQPLHGGPLCLVLDLRLANGRDGLQLQQRLAGRGEQIIFLTGFGDVPSCARAMKAGAVDFLLKPVEPDSFLAAVRLALARSQAEKRRQRRVEAARSKVAALTPREAEVFERVVAGMLNKQIAAELGTAEKTIKTHRGRVMQKMGCVSVPELVGLARLAHGTEEGTP